MPANGAKLPGAKLLRVILVGAELFKGVLTEANLSAADLTGAQLFEADLSKTVGLTQAQLNAARGNARTQLPDGVQRPEGWAPDQNSVPTNL